MSIPFSILLVWELLFHKGVVISWSLERACLEYTGLSRESEVVGGNLVSIGNLGVGCRRFGWWTELLQGLKWGTEVIPRLDCIRDGSGILCTNNRWEFGLWGLRHEVRNKLVIYFSTLDRIADQSVRRKQTLDVHRSMDNSRSVCPMWAHHFPYKPGFFLQCSCLRITTHLITQFWKLGVILDSSLLFPHSTVPVLLSPTLNRSHNPPPFHIYNAPVLV